MKLQRRDSRKLLNFATFTKECLLEYLEILFDMLFLISIN